MRNFKTEVPRRQFIKMKDLKSESHPMGKVATARPVSQGRYAESVGDVQGVGANNSPLMRHDKFQGDSMQYYGEGGNFGFNASGEKKQGRVAELVVDARSRYVGDYLALQDEFGCATREKEQYMDIHFMPALSGGFPRSLSGKFGVHGDGELSMSHRLCEDLRRNGQRMLLSDDNPGLHDSDVNQSLFYGKPILETNYLVQNQLRTSAMFQPIEAQIARDSCAIGGDVASKSTLLYDPDYSVRSHNLGHTSLALNNLRPTSATNDPINYSVACGGSGSKSTHLYDPDYPRLNFSYSSPVRINNDSMSLLESAYLSNNCRRNSLSNQTCLFPTELNDMNRCHDVGYDPLNHCLYRSDEDNPLNVVRNAGFLAAESVVYEAQGGIPPLNSSSALIPPSDIGNSDRVHQPSSSLFHNCKSHIGNDDHPIALGADLRHEMALEKNYKSFTPDVPWANKGYSQVQYGDPLVYEFDSECHGNSQNAIPGYPKKKNSVFSRLTFMQDVKKKQKNRNKAPREGYDVNTSLDEVMEMVRQSHNQWIPKRKPKALVKHNKAKSLKDKTQIISSKLKNDCFENIMNDTSLDLAATSGGTTSEPPKEKCFVDFKRRSKVRKLDHESEIKSSNEIIKSGNVVLVPQKRRKLIRPYFRKNATSGIDLGMPQNIQVPLSLEGSNSNHAAETGYALAQNEDSHKTDAEGQNFIHQTHCEDNSGHARGSVCDGGLKARDCNLAASNDESKFLESLNNQNAFSSCKDKNFHSQKGLQMIDGVYSIAPEVEPLPPICQDHHGADVVICAVRGDKSEEGLATDGNFSGAIEIKDASDSFQKSGNDNDSNKTSCHVNEGFLVMDRIKSVSQDNESLHSCCQEHDVDKIICAGGGIILEEEMPKDGGSSLTVEGKKRSEWKQNCGHEKARSETSKHVKEASRVIISKKSVWPESEALHSKCQERRNKILCSGRGIDTEKKCQEMVAFTIDDGSDLSQKSGDESGPLATSFHSKEGTNMDTKPMHLTCQERHGRGGIVTEEEMCSSSLTTEVADGSECLLNSSNGDAPIATI